MAQEAAVQPFRVVNRTGEPAVALHAVRAGRGAQGDWGGNLLSPDRPLAPEAGFRVRPNAGTGCRFDLRLVLADGRESVLPDQDICASTEVALSTAARPAAPVPAPAARAAAPAPPAPTCRSSARTSRRVRSRPAPASWSRRTGC